MLRSRVIPCLLLHNKGLVKTVKFKDPKYVGDPINAVKIFNEKEADELMFLDIGASTARTEPDYALIKKIANECRMPLCYGGGVKSVEQAQKIIKLGVEKVALSSVVFDRPEIINEIASVIGRQSVVVVIDIKKNIFGKYEIYKHNGKIKVKQGLDKTLSILEEIGIGELVVNSIDNDGEMKGYDIHLADHVRNLVSCPLTILGGASSQENILNLIDRFKVIGAAAGSLFVFKGVYRAVLINYLDKDYREKTFKIACEKKN
jgi:cyclase